jgi:hypothetical protein
MVTSFQVFLDAVGGREVGTKFGTNLLKPFQGAESTPQEALIHFPSQVSRVRVPSSALGKPPSRPVRSWAATSLRRTSPPSLPARAAWRRR